MRRPPRGFTLIEMMAVVAILGLMAGAVSLSLADRVMRAERSEVIGRIAAVDARARSAARRLGRDVTLRIDLAKQRLERLSPGDRDTAAPRAVAIPPGHRMERVRVAASSAPAGYTPPKTRGGVHRGGQIEIAVSDAGRSVTYAIELAPRDQAAPAAGDRPSERVWLVVAGMTGRTTIEHEKADVDKLFAALAGRRVHAD